MFSFDNSYARLPDRMFARVAPSPAAKPGLIEVNRSLAELLGVDPDRLASPDGLQVLSGNVVPEGAEPIATAYAGHQFGNFVPQLGDGRAILLGEVVGKDGVRRDVQLKGAGRTPFSRGGDGRAAMGPVLREYLVSEAMAALGVPTTRALAAVSTGQPVMRDEVLPGAVITRVATSHIRVGTFQFFGVRRDKEALAALTSHALARHYPASVGAENEALALLDGVMGAQARLVARWMGVGFIHGVMNTDNTSISGETIDYGPCAFVDTFDPNRKFSSIDRGGRYAFGNQPRIMHWNLTRLAEALLPLVASDADRAIELATERLDRFPQLFERAYDGVMRDKLGLEHGKPGDRSLVSDLFERLASSEVDFTNFFRRLCDAAEDATKDANVASLFTHEGAYFEWAGTWRQRLAEEDRAPALRAAKMRLANPAVIPRNHRIEEVIEAGERGDFSPFEPLSRVLSTPFELSAEDARFADPPGPEQFEYRTFCGT